MIKLNHTLQASRHKFSVGLLPTMLCVWTSKNPSLFEPLMNLVDQSFETLT